MSYVLFAGHRDPGLKAEWDEICASMRAPKETLPPMTEAEKAKAFAPPAVRELSEVFATGQVQTVNEARAPFQPTMGNAPDGGISLDLDKRGWLPDCKPEELTPSR
ncbi:MAG TPA: hypothetical protein VN948_13205 [Terriglobales bacterium]|nr:hypothetical protein [Terriglobales bacterium]